MSLDHLYRRYHRTVYLTAARYVHHEDAEDVTHDVFLRLPTTLATNAGRGNFEGWLRRVAARTALNYLRRAGRRRETSLPVASLSSTRPPDRAVLARWEVERALRDLPAPWVAVLLLKEIEGLTHDQIGRRLGIPAGTSKARLHQARAAVRAQLLRGRDPQPRRRHFCQVVVL